MSCHVTKDEDKHISKNRIKKLQKEKRLYESAYELFSVKGINNTSIDDIVKKAGVGKGTFYLYFKDKYDIIDRIIFKKSSIILKEAFDKTVDKNIEDLTEGVIYFIDYIIEHFRRNKKMLRIIHKNLSWGIYKKALIDNEQHGEMKYIQEFLEDIIKKENLDEREFQKDLFMIIELTSSVCYSSIILDEPEPIDEMKPALFKMIRRMLVN